MHRQSAKYSKCSCLSACLEQGRHLSNELSFLHSYKGGIISYKGGIVSNLHTRKLRLEEEWQRSPQVVSHPWMMDLSYSSPAGVCMMANSSRVTWSSAGFCTEAVMVLMSCGRTRSGDRMEREPMAFMEDCQTNTGVVSMHQSWHWKRDPPAEVPLAIDSASSCTCPFFLSVIYSSEEL